MFLFVVFNIYKNGALFSLFMLKKIINSFKKLLKDDRGKKIVCVSDNSALAIRYQDITAKAVLARYGYEVVTVGARAKQFSLSMVLDNLAKMIYTVVPEVMNEMSPRLSPKLPHQFKGRPKVPGRD